jgi:hypothetical protein
MLRVLPWVVGMLWSGAAWEAAAEAERSPGAGASPPVVRLAWTDPVGIMAGGWFQAAEETSRVLARFGLQAKSRAARVSEPLVSEEIRVILVPGTPPHRRGGRGAIGAASSTGSVPRVWIRPDGMPSWACRGARGGAPARAGSPPRARADVGAPGRQRVPATRPEDRPRDRRARPGDARRPSERRGGSRSGRGGSIPRGWTLTPATPYGRRCGNGPGALHAVSADGGRLDMCRLMTQHR